MIGVKKTITSLNGVINQKKENGKKAFFWEQLVFSSILGATFTTKQTPQPLSLRDW